MDSPTGSPGGLDARLFMTELAVADAAGLADWYARVLGLRVLLRDEPGRFVLLGAGPGRLALKGRPGAGPGPSTARLVFEVPDVDAAHAHLAALGVAASAPADHPSEPFLETRLVDPEGTAITLFAWRRP